MERAGILAYDVAQTIHELWMRHCGEVQRICTSLGVVGTEPPTTLGVPLNTFRVRRLARNYVGIVLLGGCGNHAQQHEHRKLGYDGLHPRSEDPAPLDGGSAHVTASLSELRRVRRAGAAQLDCLPGRHRHVQTY